MARNGTLQKEYEAQENQRRRHKELDAMTNKLRYKNKKLATRKAKIDSNETTREAKNDTAPPRHYPSFFTEHAPLSSLKKRMNLLTPYTGCSIAAFQYNLGKHAHPEFNDCFIHCGKPFANKRRGIRVDNVVALLQHNDTLFVQFNKLDHFVNKTMPLINVDFVLISGNEQKVPPVSREVFGAVVNNPRVLHWFMSNMDVYSHDFEHPKVSQMGSLCVCVYT